MYPTHEKIQRDKKGPLFQSKAASVILMFNFTENFICTDQNLFVYIIYAIFSYQVTQTYKHEYALCTALDISEHPV